MSLNNVMPIEHARPVIQDSINAAMEGARNAAATVAGGMQNMADNPGRTYEDVKVSVKQVAVPAGAMVTRQVQHHSRMIAPLLCGVFITILTIALQYYSPAQSGHGHLSSLIPLFMIMGEPILTKAVSVVTANPRQDSPHFGCGWLSWSLSAAMTTMSKTKDLVAKPENSCKLVNLEYGHGRVNNSFVLSHILRDLEWRHERKNGGLSIEILDAGKQTGPLSWAQVFRDNAVSTATMLVQLFLAIFAYLSTGDVNPLLFFSAGLFLMEAVVNLPAWSAIKYSARKDRGCKSIYALMRGNGHRHVFIIRNVHDDAWNLEDMAGGGSTHYNYAATPERLVIILTALTFAALTIAASAMPNTSAFAILAILGMGTLKNILTAALPRKTWMHGVPLKPVETISNDRKVMVALQELETKYPGSGDALVEEFFPGGLREDEQKWWDDRKKARKEKKAAEKARKAAAAQDTKEDIIDTFDVVGENDVSAKKLEKEMEKAIRGQ